MVHITHDDTRTGEGAGGRGGEQLKICMEECSNALAGVGSIIVDKKMLKSPSGVLNFWFGPLNASSTVEEIESRMGLWFGSKDPEFDNTQRANRCQLE